MKKNTRKSKRFRFNEARICRDSEMAKQKTRPNQMRMKNKNVLTKFQPFSTFRKTLSLAPKFAHAKNISPSLSFSLQANRMAHTHASLHTCRICRNSLETNIKVSVVEKYLVEIITISWQQRLRRSNENRFIKNRQTEISLHFSRFLFRCICHSWK